LSIDGGQGPIMPGSGLATPLDAKELSVKLLWNVISRGLGKFRIFRD